MFERFTTQARAVVVGAQQEARRLHHRSIGTEHLLLSLLVQDTRSAAVLARHGLTHDAVTEAVLGHSGSQELDAGALEAVGIDLETVRRSVEATFGPGALDQPRGPGGQPAGHIGFSPRAKKALELSLREALAMKSRIITDGHIALGVLRGGDGLAVKVLHDRGVDLPALRDDLRDALHS